MHVNVVCLRMLFVNADLCVDGTYLHAQVDYLSKCTVGAKWDEKKQPLSLPVGNRGTYEWEDYFEPEKLHIAKSLYLEQGLWTSGCQLMGGKHALRV